MQNITNSPAKAICLLVFVTFALETCVLAQSTASDSIAKDFDELFARVKADSGKEVTQKLDSAVMAVVAGSETQYNQFSNMHLQRSLSWQFYSSILIFFMVIFIVGFGLYLSYLQFKIFESIISAGIKTKEKETITQAVDNGEKLLRSSVELSKDSLKINSAVVGLVILFISLGFFFLYLKYVYKIEVLNPFKPI